MRRRRRRRRIDASQKSAKDAKRARPLAIQISHQTWTDTKMVSEMRSQNYYTHLSLGQYNFFQKWNHNTPSMPIIEEFNIYSNYYRPHGIVKKKIEVLRAKKNATSNNKCRTSKIFAEIKLRSYWAARTQRRSKIDPNVHKIIEANFFCPGKGRSHTPFRQKDVLVFPVFYRMAINQIRLHRLQFTPIHIVSWPSQTSS